MNVVGVFKTQNKINSIVNKSSNVYQCGYHLITMIKEFQNNKSIWAWIVWTEQPQSREPKYGTRCQYLTEYGLRIINTSTL